MRALLLSDIHANKPALDAVLEHAYRDGARFGRVLFMGDAVGYGPHPREVLETLQSLDAQCVLGNHDLSLLQLLDGQKVAASGTGSQVLVWQIGRLSERDIRLLRSWRDVIDDPQLGLRVRHGTPTSLSEYVTVDAARENFRQWQGNLALVGHTHVPAAYLTLQGTDAAMVKEQPLRPLPGKDSVRYLLPPRARVIANVGSVGQPRDGDPRAAYGIYDAQKRSLEVFRVPYDIAKTRRELRAAGLPDSLGERLLAGR